MTSKTFYDAVVVGGGHNGLVAAAYLARAGQSVLVLEGSETLGGATASKAIFSGLDARLSRYSYLVSLLPRKIVEDLGLNFTIRRRSIASCTPYERDGAPNAMVISNTDEEASRSSFEALAGRNDWQGYQRLLHLERAIATRIWPSLLEPLRSRSNWAQSLDSAMENEAWEAFVERPLGEAVERHIHDDVVRGLVFTDAKIGIFTHPHDPTLLQNRCFLLHVVGQGTGEWQVPVGGMGALVDALAASARQAGADLVTRASVTAIAPGAQRHAVAFRRDGDDRDQTVDATRVLVNAGPQVFDRLLGRAHEDRATDEGSVCKVNLLLRRLPQLKANIDPRDAFRGTFHVDESYDEMQTSYRQASDRQIPERPPFETYCHTLTDDSILGPDLRGAGYHTMTLFGLDAPYRLFETDPEGTKAELLRRYLRRMNRHLVEPIEDCLATDSAGNPCIEIKSPLDLERELALHRGNIFHQAPSWFFAESAEDEGSWGVETEYKRIYRCGASAVRGGAVSGIPGHNAACRIFQELSRARGATPLATSATGQGRRS